MSALRLKGANVTSKPKSLAARVGLMVAVAGAVMVAAVAPASAAPSSDSARPSVVLDPSAAPTGALSDDTCYGGWSYDGGALACFVPYGEHLWLCDDASDGHHPAVRYRINGGSWTLRHADIGAGNCIDINLSIAESGYIDFEPRNYEKNTIVSYGPVFRVSANG